MCRACRRSWLPTHATRAGGRWPRRAPECVRCRAAACRRIVGDEHAPARDRRTGVAAVNRRPPHDVEALLGKSIENAGLGPDAESPAATPFGPVGDSARRLKGCWSFAFGEPDARPARSLPSAPTPRKNERRDSLLCMASCLWTMGNRYWPSVRTEYRRSGVFNIGVILPPLSRAAARFFKKRGVCENAGQAWSGQRTFDLIGSPVDRHTHGLALRNRGQLTVQRLGRQSRSIVP